jgi:polysaccharide export outer membrane protein
MASLRDNVNPEEDILLKPFDVISVERAEMVYISGEVGRVGAFELQEKDSMSVLQALTLAGGVSRDANLQQVRILRPVLNSSRRAEVPLDLKQILAGRQADFPLLPNDLLYVPRKGLSRSAIGRSMVTVLPVAMSVMNIVLFATLR